MKPFKCPAQFLKMIAGRHTQIPITGGIIDHLKTAKQTVFKVSRNLAGANIVHEECTQPLIPKPCNHFAPNKGYCTTLRYTPQ